MFTFLLINITLCFMQGQVTNNLIRRIYEHKKKVVRGFTEKYNLNKLVYYEIFTDIENAIKREKSIKNLVRRKKNSLINNFNPSWKDLFEDIVQI